MGGRVSRRRGASLALATAVLWAASGLGPAVARPPEVVPLRLIAFGDLHGNLLPPQGSRSKVVRSDGESVPAGGAAYLAAYVRQLRSQAENSVLYSVGDAWGSSPLESAMFHEEPTVELLNALDVNALALGNHEFDHGVAELQRLRDGGCHPEGCRYVSPFEGAQFPFLGANLSTADGSPAALPFSVDYIDGVPVGVIGVLPRNTPDVISAESIEGLQFGDEVEAADRTADILDALGVRSIVLLYKGDLPVPSGHDTCDPESGPAAAVATRVSPKIDVIVTSDGESHFNCSFLDPLGKPRTVVQGASHGRILSVADLTIDRESRDVIRDRTVSFNQVVTHDIAPDSRTKEFVDRAVDQSASVAGQSVGTITADLTREKTFGGESTLGNVIADAQLAAAESAGAQIALTNPDGMRADLTHADDGVVTFGETYAVQPFGNRLLQLEVTGAQLVAILEQQFQTDVFGRSFERILSPSHTLRYTIDRAAEQGRRIQDVTVAGQPLDPAATYVVVVNDFLAAGGDGFTAFTEGRRTTGAGADLDALNGYLSAHGPVSPPPTDRISVR
ncbi:bifunctional metallophosphatase/5'-nucleotidase [Rhodococcus sp. HM1]|uniref:bifunctional metallophosphatase/5'-nucleotidase n=1 Tax=Rhodococcus sp. HM1 TaxID=2937759 RepID=UPI00200AB9CA|nr:bifunctional UDP-sugar hydrolase/5'-nucleotidase [Rhodococcus sp. HM1]MCK8675339.1 bifunctional metallophosphatase/5'-nucleotidase [Rhodococcus sp. HM1]